MKTNHYLIIVLAFLSLNFTGCKENDDENPGVVSQVADYNTQATINVSSPHVYSFGVTGTTHSEILGNAFTSTSNFDMGASHFSNIKVDGTIQNGQVTFTDKQVILKIPVPGTSDTLQEEVTFSTGPVTLGTANIGGNGTIKLRMLDDTVTEYGSFNYTMTKVK
jgi:hypothetical protein